MFFQIGLGTALDIALSYGLAVALAEADGRLIATGLIFAGLTVATLVLWLRKFVWGWVAFKLGGRAFLSDHLERFVLNSNLPMPDARDDSAQSFLSRVVDDVDAPVAARLAAAREIAASEAIYRLSFSAGVQTSIAFDEAVKRLRVR